jgi:serine phosphatase RsbU (regulator of sigma subunit)/DNA-binding response OmpR family regulator
VTVDPLIPARILVVDDSESNRYVLATWLRRAGYEVFEGKTGAEALEIAAAEEPDLVVLDINLPDMTGYDVCERIKSDRATSSIPVLHVSATAIQPADRSEGLRRGAEGYLVEPLEREELLASIEALLRGAAAERTAIVLARRLRALNDATYALNEAPSLEHLLTAIVREASALFETTAIANAVVGDRSFLAVAVSGEDAVLHDHDPASLQATRRALAGRTTVGAAALMGLIPGHRVSTFLVAEFRDPVGVHGFLLVGRETNAPRTLGDESEVVLTQYARAAGIALRNARSFDVERQIALTLQKSLLPDVVPSIPGLDIAVRYQASAEHAEVGGDFYEIFTLEDGRVVLAIGDVVGHSLEAAAVMAQLRTAIRSYMLEGHGPAAMLARLNRLLLRFHPDVTATVCCAVYDPADGRGVLANAGHPPPLLRTATEVGFLPLGGPLLGVEATAAAERVFTLARDDLFVLFTDGLIERRRETIEDGLARLASVVAEGAGELDTLCDRMVRLAGPASATDDIAIVAVRRTR